MTATEIDPAATMGQEERRLPYFFTDGPNGAVLCPDCLHAMAGEGLPMGSVVARYFTDQMLRCSSCLILIGPINGEEFYGV